MVNVIINNFWDKVQPRDVIALIVLILCFVGKYFNIDGKLDVLMALIIGYYFSKRVYEEKNK